MVTVLEVVDKGQCPHTHGDKASWTLHLLPGPGATAVPATHLAILILLGQPAFFEIQQVGLRERNKEQLREKQPRVWICAEAD